MGGAGKKFVRTSQLLLFFSAVPPIAVKLTFKRKLTKNTDAELTFSGRRGHGHVRVLLVIMIVLFSSVSESEREVFFFLAIGVAYDCVEGKGVRLGRLG